MSVQVVFRCCGFATGCTDGVIHRQLPPGSKLSVLMDSCLNSQHATADSKFKAAHLLSACALADSVTYKMLLPLLEKLMWIDNSISIKMTAAAGRTSLSNHDVAIPL